MSQVSDQPTYRTEREYEFSPEQNELIARLSNAMRWVSVPMLALGSFRAGTPVQAGYTCPAVREGRSRASAS